MLAIILVVTILLISIMIFIKSYNPLKLEGFTSPHLSRIYFIVMKKYPERVRNIQEIIEKYQMKKVHIFDAIDGDTIDKNQLLKDNQITPSMYEKLRSGAIGCALSHIALWKQLVSSQDPYWVIFEDDITLTNDVDQQLNLFLSHLPDDFDIAQIYLSKNRDVSNLSHNQIVNEYVKTGYPQNGTVAYIISRKGAKKLLKYCQPIHHAIDIMIRKNISNGNLISYVPINQIVKHEFKYISSICKNAKFCPAF